MVGEVHGRRMSLSNNSMVGPANIQSYRGLDDRFLPDVWWIKILPLFMKGPALTEDGSKGASISLLLAGGQWMSVVS